MSRLLGRLLVLLAVLLMPFGMTTAPAAAHDAMAGMPMGHCPDQAPGHGMKGGLAECTMACAAALPALDKAALEPLSDAIQPALTPRTPRLDSIRPETAKPPPRIA